MNASVNPDAIVVTGLRKAFGDHVVLDGIDLSVEAGAVFALLGPNGAGKTTVVNILSTLIPADAGEVTVGGHDLRRNPGGIRGSIGVTGQFSAVDGLLTGRENLRLMADLAHLGRDAATRVVPELLERFDLTDAADRPVATWSGGMKRRLDLAMTLVAGPRVIFLDEPTTGLDPRSRRGLWEIVETLVTGGVTVFLTTQYLDEADRLADRIAVLDRGRIVAEGTARELKAGVAGGHVVLTFAGPDDVRRAHAALPDGLPDADDGVLRLATDGTPASLRAVLDRIEAADLPVRDLSVRTPDLDDVFLALTGQAASEPTDLAVTR